MGLFGKRMPKEKKKVLGTLKTQLKYFLEELPSLKLKDQNTLDIGSSTGGFTQILLNNEVKKVTCVDVGSNQLHEKIKNEDPTKASVIIFQECPPCQEGWGLQNKASFGFSGG